MLVKFAEAESARGPELAYVPKKFRHELALKNGAAKKVTYCLSRRFYVQKFYKAAALI